MRAILPILLSFIAVVGDSTAQDRSADTRKAEYVHAVTRGAGLMPWQQSGVSDEERAFRAEVEQRKDRLLEHSRDVKHPALYTEEDFARARANGESSPWAKSWITSQLSLADYVAQQPDGWIDAMIPKETPAHGYGFTCPNCVGEKSQEATGYSLADWSYREPDIITCRACGHRYPDPAFPETEVLVMPRTGGRIAYYLNDAERAQIEDRSGKLAWHWVAHPIHVSFSGLIRELKVGFMRDAAQSLGFAYAFTGDARYAEAARDILVRFAQCYRNWLYRDYWDTYADCDPMYAAWHDKALPIEWKRHLCEDVFANDKVDSASMMQTYWGAGRLHPSTDNVSGLRAFCLAYDLTCGAREANTNEIWSEEQKHLVERDLLLEYIIGAEPFVGGADKADNANNKSPRVYNAMACVAKCLGIASMADTALRGYERVRDDSFVYDGFSKESPAYNNMYLSQLLVIPETLHGFRWPDGFGARQGIVDYYASDPKLRLMYRDVLWSLLPNGRYLPLSDTEVETTPSDHIVQIGLKRYPDLYAGTLPNLSASHMTEYGLFQLSEDRMKEDGELRLPETCYPAWRTAILRNGSSASSATLAMAFNKAGGHRHMDNLGIVYESGEQTILGDQGYLCDMPNNAWIRSTFSHNLVVVDDQEQRFDGREPQFVMMATSPLASVAEATSNAYGQCSEYRRRVVLVKGPNGHTFAMDLFRVIGGHKHAFRVYSEIAASDIAGNVLTFNGLSIPQESPLPVVGASLERDDIFGLRDIRSATAIEPTWQATWRDNASAYRLWMLTQCNAIEASNGPGQRTLTESGRRVRYVDANRTGDSGESTFVAIHEPGSGNGTLPITMVQRLDVSAAGHRAVAVRVETSFGAYLLLHDFDSAVQIEGVTFQGDFTVVEKIDGTVRQYVAVGASKCLFGNGGFEGAVAGIAREVKESDVCRLVPLTTQQAEWPIIDSPAQAFVRVKTDDGWTGFPVDKISSDGIHVRDYPLPAVQRFELPSVRYAACN